jgi:hypothetical protein
MLTKLIPNDDLPLRLGNKVVPLQDRPAPPVADNGPAVRWVVNPNTPEGEIDQTIQASDAVGAIAAGVIEQFEPGVTERCPDCGVDRAYFGCFCMVDSAIEQAARVVFGYDPGSPSGDCPAFEVRRVDPKTGRIVYESINEDRLYYGGGKTATGLQMLMEAGMKREDELRESMRASRPPRFTRGDPDCNACR